MPLVDTLEPDTQDRALALLDLAHAEGIDLIITSGKRTCAEQAAIYGDGTGATRARGCRSWHVFGRAFDVLAKDGSGAIIHNGYDPVYDRLGELGESLGLKWGGKFSWGRDAGHFEYHPGVTTEMACPDPSQCEHYASMYPEPGQPSKPPTEPLLAGGSSFRTVALWSLLGVAVGVAARVLTWPSMPKTSAAFEVGEDEKEGEGWFWIVGDEDIHLESGSHLEWILENAHHIDPDDYGLAIEQFLHEGAIRVAGYRNFQVWSWDDSALRRIQDHIARVWTKQMLRSPRRVLVSAVGSRSYVHVPVGELLAAKSFRRLLQ